MVNLIKAYKYKYFLRSIKKKYPNLRFELHICKTCKYIEIGYVSYLPSILGLRDRIPWTNILVNWWVYGNIHPARFELVFHRMLKKALKKYIDISLS